MATNADVQPSAYIAPETDTLRRNKIIIALLCVYFIWGSTYLGMRLALDSFPPFILGGLRFALAAGLLFAYMAVRRLPMPSWVEIRNALIVGCLTLGFGTGGVAFAEQWVSSGLASLAVAAVPLWTAAFAALLIKRPSRTEWIGLLIGFSGIVLLNLGSSLSAAPLGMLALIIAPVGWSFGSIISRRLKMPDGMTAIAFECLGAGLMLGSLAILRGEQMPATPPTTQSWLAVIYLATFGSLIGYTAYMYLLKTVRPSLATSYAYINPVVAVGLGILFVGETISGLGIVAMIIILSGVAIVATFKEKR